MNRLIADVLSPPPRRPRPLDEWVMVVAGSLVVGWILFAALAAVVSL